MVNPLNLFDEFDDLNGGGTPTGGTWYLTSHPSGAPTLSLCISCDSGATWALTVITVGAPGVGTPICSVGNHTPLIDINGDVGGCAPLAYPDGAYVFTYKPPNNAPCVSLTATLTVNVYTLGISLSRTSEACVYEAYAENPFVGGDTVPDILMPTDFITPYFLFDLNVDKRSIENCGSNSTVQTDVEYIGTSLIDYGNGDSISGPKLIYRIETPTSAFSPAGGGYITALRLGLSGDINLSSIVRGSGESIHLFASRIANDPGGLFDQLDTLVGADHYEASVVAVTPNGIRFSFTCANSGSWEGIDKTDGYLEWCAAGGCPPAGLVSTTAVTEVVSGDFTKVFPSMYTTPCGDDLSVIIGACPNRSELEIYDLAACNFGTLSLINEAGRRYHVYDNGSDAEGGFRQNICNGVEITISASNCPGPIGPATYDWSSGSTDNPKLFDPLEEDNAQATCGECMISEGYCYPLAGKTGHDGLATGISCAVGASASHIISLGSVVENCDGDTITMNQLTVHDVPAAFTSSTPDAGTQRITNTVPADVLPRTYYVAYRYREAGDEWSNYELVRTNVLKGDCCS